MRKLPFAKKIPRDFRSNVPLHRWHGDLKGKIVHSSANHCYYLILVDEATRYVMARPLRSKHIVEEYKSCVNLMENTTGRRLKFSYKRTHA